MKRYLLAFLLLAVSHVSIAQPAPLMPSMQLEQWWPFCSATDLLDRTFTGFDLIGSNVTATSDRFGAPNRAYNFNGINSELHYTTTFSIPLFGIADFSYSCHIFPTVAQDAIILYNGDPNIDGLGIVMTDITGTGPGTFIGMRFGGLVTEVRGNVTLNQWHHLCMKRNGNSYLLFIDGLLSGPAYIPTGFPASGYNVPTTVFQLGLDLATGTKAFTGKIDDVSIYGRQVSDVEVGRIQAFNPNIIFSLGPVDTALCPNSLTLGAPSIDTVRYPNKILDGTNGFLYTWSTGDTTTSITLDFLSTPEPPVVRSLTITRQFSCPSFDIITVRHIIPTVYIGPDTSFCLGDSLLLNPTPGSGTMDYLWNTGDTVPSIYASTTGTYWLRVDSSFTLPAPGGGFTTTHCIGTDTADIAIAPPISVTLPDDILRCQGESITLSSSDTYVDPTYQWSDGFTTSPTLLVTASGTYWLTVRDSACSASDTIEVAIVDVSINLLSNDTAICSGASVLANATGSPGVEYQWTPTTGIPISDVPTPTISPDTSSFYKLTASIDVILDGIVRTCSVADSFFIDVQPFPIVKMGGNRNVCEFDSIRINPSVTPSWYTNYLYDWTPGTFLDDSTAPAVVFTAGDTTKLVLIVTTPAGCEGSDSAIIYKYNGNFAYMNTDTAICPGDSVKLFPVSLEPGITTYQWSPATYINNPLSATPVIKPINDISYTIVATSQFGCKDTLSYAIHVYPAAVITLNDSAVLFPGESYEISPVTNCSYYSWTPPVGISDTAISNPIANPPVDTRYILTGRTQDGCIAKDSISIRVNENSIIAVPNAFVPGGLNGELKVILRGIARLRYFRIYDRWGAIVFEGKSIETGWDGTYKGVPQPLGVYIYEAEAITDVGQLLRKQGNITLLR